MAEPGATGRNADRSTYNANKAAKLGAYSRRQAEWTFQSNFAKTEINQIFKQIRGAQIREAIAKKEYHNHQTQMSNAQQVVDFLHGNDRRRRSYSHARRRPSASTPS